MSSRVTIKELKRWINEWNEYHPEVLVCVRAYDGYYHIQFSATSENIIVEKNPGKAWSEFCIFKRGYSKGYEVATNNILEDDRK